MLGEGFRSNQLGEYGDFRVQIQKSVGSTNQTEVLASSNEQGFFLMDILKAKGEGIVVVTYGKV
jgi:hypothetical protein